MRNVVLVLVLLPAVCLNTPVAIATRGAVPRDDRVTGGQSNQTPAEPGLVDPSSAVVSIAGTRSSAGSLSWAVNSRAVTDFLEAPDQLPQLPHRCLSLLAQHVLLRI
jgi:hypothetical protein